MSFLLHKKKNYENKMKWWALIYLDMSKDLFLSLMFLFLATFGPIFFVNTYCNNIGNIHP